MKKNTKRLIKNLVALIFIAALGIAAVMLRPYSDSTLIKWGLPIIGLIVFIYIIFPLLSDD